MVKVSLKLIRLEKIYFIAHAFNQHEDCFSTRRVSKKNILSKHLNARVSVLIIYIFFSLPTFPAKFIGRCEKFKYESSLAHY